MLILSGGVSMGRFDYVPQVLAELDVRVVFHKVAQRPGKPMWFGVGPGGQTVYALPGNPVSTLVCLARYVFAGWRRRWEPRPGAPEPIALAERFEVKPALSVFVPVQVATINAQAQRQAVLKPTRGSGDFTSLIGTDGFVELPPGPASARGGHPGGVIFVVIERLRASPSIDTILHRHPARAPAAARYAESPAARPAHLGDGPVQLPLPVLHAAGDVP